MSRLTPSQAVVSGAVQTCPGRYPEHGESPDHDWEERVDWMGDPSVPHGTVSWTYHVCRICGEEG